MPGCKLEGETCALVALNVEIRPRIFHLQVERICDWALQPRKFAEPYSTRPASIARVKFCKVSQSAFDMDH